MSSLQDRYFIRENYAPNLEPDTFEGEDVGSYWTPERRKAASEYQWHVYRMAAAYAVRNRLKRVIDIGCGPPVKLQELFGPLDLDLHLMDQPSVQGLASEILPQAEFHSIDLESSGPSDSIGKFDLIICADVVEHLIEPTGMLEMIKSMLSETGKVFLSTPERDILRGMKCRKCNHPSHVREWNKEEFAHYLEDVGFTVEQHTVLPQKRCGGAEAIVGRMRYILGKPRKTYSCQLAVCSC